MSEDQYSRFQGLNNNFNSQRSNPSLILNRKLLHINPGNMQLSIGSNIYGYSLLFINLFLYMWVGSCIFGISIISQMGDGMFVIVPILFLFLGYFFCIYAGFRIYKISYLNKIESAKNSKELVETYQRLLEDPGKLVVSLLRQNYPRMSDDDSTFSQTIMHKQQYRLRPTWPQPINISSFLQRSRLTCITFELQEKHMDNQDQQRISQVVNQFRQQNKHMIDASSIIQTSVQCGENDLNRQSIYSKKDKPYSFYKFGFMICAAIGLMWVFELWTRCNIRVQVIKIQKDISLE